MRLGDLKEHEGLEGFYKKGACHVCGGAPDAVWVGHETLFICRSCAIDTVPILIADAIYYGFIKIDYLSSQLKEIEAVFWKAVANSALYEKRHKGPTLK